jgi:hypothetical protein
MNFLGVVRNPLPLVRFRQKDRFSTPLVEKPPAPAAVRRFHCRRHFWVSHFDGSRRLKVSRDVRGVDLGVKTVSVARTFWFRPRYLDSRRRRWQGLGFLGPRRRDPALACARPPPCWRWLALVVAERPTTTPRVPPPPPLFVLSAKAAASRSAPCALACRCPPRALVCVKIKECHRARALLSSRARKGAAPHQTTTST